MAHDMKVVPHRLESLTICSADIINSLALSYNDHNGRQHTLGPWGGNGGSAYTVSDAIFSLGKPTFLCFVLFLSFNYVSC